MNEHATKIQIKYFSHCRGLVWNSLRQDIQLWTNKIYKRNNYVSYENGYKLLLYFFLNFMNCYWERERDIQGELKTLLIQISDFFLFCSWLSMEKTQEENNYFYFP